MIRRRKQEDSSNRDASAAQELQKSDKTPPPAPETDSESVEPENDATEATKEKPPRAKKRRSFTIFLVGGVLGLFLAGLAKNQDLVGLELIQDLRLESLIDVIPAGILKEASDISVLHDWMQQHVEWRLKVIQKREKEVVSYDAFSTGLALKAEGLDVSHPVIMIPGVISTGLESWGTSEQSRPYFRKRLWGSWSMLRAMITDRASWKQHIMLDKVTGLDPPDIKLRASMGFDATDFFITGYWIWSKILENLASIGYDPTSAYTASYDWRLAYGNLEVRDQYFSRLQMHIETARKLHGKKVVVVAHSMGSQVAHYFFKWVEAKGKGYGNGGPSWVEDHVDSFINISGCMLGAIKGLPAVLSGEMRDTVQLNQVAVYGLEKFFGKEDRAEIMRAMPGISSMLPKGGNVVWGNTTWAPDDEPNQERTFGSTIRFLDQNLTHIIPERNLTVEDSLLYLMENSDEWYRNQVVANYSHQVAFTKKQIDANEHIPSKWVNPLESRLPLAPSLKIYCFYGIGKPTERGYYFKPLNDPISKLKVVIDPSVNDGGSDHGVVVGEGDGTVPLLSSGYMCSKGWKMKRYNPAGVQIKTVEMPHEPDRFDIRGGPNTADHVDILGRPDLSELILRVVAGQGYKIQEKIVSNIREYSDRVQIFDD